MSKRPDEFIAIAQACEHAAAAALFLENQRRFRRLAEQWRELAVKAEWQERERPKDAAAS